MLDMHPAQADAIARLTYAGNLHARLALQGLRKVGRGPQCQFFSIDNRNTRRCRLQIGFPSRCGNDNLFKGGHFRRQRRATKWPAKRHNGDAGQQFFIRFDTHSLTLPGESE